MDDAIKTEFTKEVMDAGKTVSIIARLIEDELWELSIQGKTGQFTTWSEWFSSSESAIEAGMSAILKEGIEEFYSDSCFDYLQK